MADLSMLEKRKFEDLFGMQSGYVLDFSNQSFSALFQSTVGINIYSDRYSTNGESKAKRLRSFWEQESNSIVGKVLDELLSFWKYQQDSSGSKNDNSTYNDALAICSRLLGRKNITKSDNPDEEFLKKKFEDAEFEKLTIEPSLIPLLSKRFHEAQICKNNNANLACIFLCGSILEGLLLGAAVQNPKVYNTSNASPKNKDNNAVKKHHEWTLSEFIDVSYDIGFISLDVKKFSHSVRDFRNYIHPYQQISSGFNPDKHTAEICLHVVRAAVASLAKKREL